MSHVICPKSVKILWASGILAEYESNKPNGDGRTDKKFRSLMLAGPSWIRQKIAEHKLFLCMEYSMFCFYFLINFHHFQTFSSKLLMTTCCFTVPSPRPLAYAHWPTTPPPYPKDVDKKICFFTPT